MGHNISLSPKDRQEKEETSHLTLMFSLSLSPKKNCSVPFSKTRCLETCPSAWTSTCPACAIACTLANRCCFSQKIRVMTHQTEKMMSWFFLWVGEATVLFSLFEALRRPLKVCRTCFNTYQVINQAGVLRRAASGFKKFKLLVCP